MLVRASYRAVERLVGPGLSHGAKVPARCLSSAEIFCRDTVRAHRDAAADGDYDSYSYLREEVAQRLTERLCDSTRKFSRALDLGSAGGHMRMALEGAGVDTIVECDVSERMLARSGRRHGGVDLEAQVCVDEEWLPFADASFDVVVSNLSMHWINDLPRAMSEIRRVLRPDGVFMGALIGGESLQELRHSFAAAELERVGGVGQHVSPQAGVRDCGNLVTAAGFTMPTVDYDIIKVYYPNVFVLMEHLSGMGEGNALRKRAPTMSRDVLLSTGALYQSLYGEKDEDGDPVIPATFEVVFMIGWAPDPSQPKAKRRGSAELSLKDVGHDSMELGEFIQAPPNPDKVVKCVVSDGHC